MAKALSRLRGTQRRLNSARLMRATFQAESGIKTFVPQSTQIRATCRSSLMTFCQRPPQSGQALSGSAVTFGM